MIKSEQRKEALIRMKMLGLHENAINEFREEGKINISESNGFLYGVENKNEKQWFNEWQKETGNLIYHIIRTVTNFGELLNVLYISQNKEEWENEKRDIEENLIFSYVKNLDVEEFSEFGFIRIIKCYEGLVRVG